MHRLGISELGALTHFNQANAYQSSSGDILRGLPPLAPQSRRLTEDGTSSVPMLAW